MHNIFSYLKKFGKLSFLDEKFNEVDVVTLATLSYMNFESCLDRNRSYSFQEGLNNKNIFKIIKGGWFLPLDYRFIKELRKTTRYNNLNFKDFLCKEEKDKLIQYFSLFMEDDNYNYIIFRGTNSTVFGCIEDLSFGLNEGCNSLNTALSFTNKILASNNKPTMLIGHSKGGGLAEQTYLYLDKSDKQRIKNIYNLDGPGNVTSLSDEVKSSLKDKGVKFITEKTVFGLLLYSSMSETYIKSKYFWLFHHITYSWFIDNNHLKRCLKPSLEAVKRRERLNNFIVDLSNEEIHSLIDNCFYLMDESKFYKISDFKMINIHHLNKAYKKILNNSHYNKLFKDFLIMCKDVFLF